MHYQYHVISGKAAVLIVGLTFLGGAASGYGTAHASPDVGEIVCQQSRLGVSPGEIAEQLHQGDPRYSEWQTGQQVWTALQDCS